MDPLKIIPAMKAVSKMPKTEITAGLSFLFEYGEFGKKIKAASQLIFL